MATEKNPEAGFDFTKSEEFRAAVASEAAKLAGDIARQEVKAAVENVQSEIALALKNAAPTGSMAEFSSQLAMAIAELTDQSGATGRVRVPPEEMVKRQKAFETLGALVEDTRAQLKAALALPDGDPRKARLIEAHRPHYAVVSKVYLHERMVEPWTRGPGREAIRSEVYWTGFPSNGLRPLNAIAQRIFEVYREWVGLPQHIVGTEQPRGWMTNNGLWVKGDPNPNYRAFTAVDSTTAEAPFADHLSVVGDKAGPVPHGGAFASPDSEFVQVLGTTTAGRARQNVKDPLLAGRERGA